MFPYFRGNNWELSNYSFFIISLNVMDLNTNQLIAAGREHNFHFTSPSWTRSINYEQIFSVCSPWMARKTLFRAHLSPSVKPNQLTICRNGNYSQFATESLPFVPSEESDSLNKLEYPERWCSSTVRKWEKKIAKWNHSSRHFTTERWTSKFHSPIERNAWYSRQIGRSKKTYWRKWFLFSIMFSIC